MAQNAKIPTPQQRREIIEKYAVPPNIVAHMKRVGDVARFVAAKMADRTDREKGRGVAVNVALAASAGALHDILKISDFSPEIIKQMCEHIERRESGYMADYADHAHHVHEHHKKESEPFSVKLLRVYEEWRGTPHQLAGAAALKDCGFPQVGEIVGKHGYESLTAPAPHRPTTWEEKILWYADARVLHHSIVSLKERIEDLKIRYAHLPAMSDPAIEQAAYDLEEELCTAANITPEDIAEASIPNTHL